MSLIEDFQNIKTPNKKIKQFGFLVSIIFFILFILYSFYFEEKNRWPFLLIALLPLFLLAFFPGTLKPIYKLWMLIGLILEKTPIKTEGEEQ
jgi:hypothetical protein